MRLLDRMEQDDISDSVLIPIQEEISERHTYCRCNREDTFLIVYITTICCIMLGGCIFILIWLILNHP